MPWSSRDTRSLCQEFITLAQHEGANRRELCRRFGISPRRATSGWPALPSKAVRT